jgi:Fe-S cluster biogenesis protein NfuA
MFIQTEATPNPATLKFIPGEPVTGGAPREFADADAARATSPLAFAVLEVEGVESVFLGADFVAVSKGEAHDWAHLKPGILAAIMDHYVAGLPVLTDGEAAPAPADEPVFEGEAAETVAKIKELLDTRVRPAVAADGGDIVFQNYDAESGIVLLHMRGACAGCPSSTMTLKAGIENLLKHYLPNEVRAVEAAL